MYIINSALKWECIPLWNKTYFSHLIINNKIHIPLYLFWSKSFIFVKQFTTGKKHKPNLLILMIWLDFGLLKKVMKTNMIAQLSISEGSNRSYLKNILKCWRIRGLADWVEALSITIKCHFWLFKNRIVRWLFCIYVNVNCIWVFLIKEIHQIQFNY